MQLHGSSFECKLMLLKVEMIQDSGKATLKRALLIVHELGPLWEFCRYFDFFKRYIFAII